MAPTHRAAHDNPLACDLDEILEANIEWSDLRGERIFLTGGSGFVGSWMLESIAWANDRLALRSRVVVLTRDPDQVMAKLPHIVTRPDVELVHGDIEHFAFPTGTFSHIVHAASPTSLEDVSFRPKRLFETIVHGTERVLELAASCGASRLLLLSSGAVYGTQPPDVEHLSETFRGGPDCADIRAVYAEAKRAAELLWAMAASEGGFAAKIARCFAFVGPYLPLGAQYAIGNFLRDRISGRPIHVLGDGTPLRSYLYAADLAVWLWTILFRAASGRPYNVGSDAALSIADVARTVGNDFEPRLPVVITQSAIPGAARQRYVPSTARATTELGLRPRIAIRESIQRTLDWWASPALVRRGVSA
jgi:dTDP-glucose 4,6-dehydratase